MQFPVPRPKALIAVSIIALVLAACGARTQAGGGDAATALTVAIASPADGGQVSIPFDVQLEANVPLGAPETGNHHAHLYFDTNTDSGDYDIVYGNSWQVTRSLAPGQHTIIAALANPDHSLAGPTQTITVTVGGSGAGDGSGPPASAPPTIDYWSWR